MDDPSAESVWVDDLNLDQTKAVLKELLDHLKLQVWREEAPTTYHRSDSEGYFLKPVLDVGVQEHIDGIGKWIEGNPDFTLHSSQASDGKAVANQANLHDARLKLTQLKTILEDCRNG